VTLLQIRITRPTGPRKCRSVSEGSSQRLKNCSPNKTSRLLVSNRRRNVAALVLLSTHQAPPRQSSSVSRLRATQGTRTPGPQNSQASQPPRQRAGSDRNLLLHRAIPAKNLRRGPGHQRQSTSTPACNVTCLMKRPPSVLSLDAFGDRSCHFNNVSYRGVLETTC
jgi:hypothetical protein